MVNVNEAYNTSDVNASNLLVKSPRMPVITANDMPSDVACLDRDKKYIVPITPTVCLAVYRTQLELRHVVR